MEIKWPMVCKMTSLLLPIFWERILGTDIIQCRLFLCIYQPFKLVAVLNLQKLAKVSVGFKIPTPGCQKLLNPLLISNFSIIVHYQNTHTSILPTGVIKPAVRLNWFLTRYQRSWVFPQLLQVLTSDGFLFKVSLFRLLPPMSFC